MILKVTAFQPFRGYVGGCFGPHGSGRRSESHKARQGRRPGAEKESEIDSLTPVLIHWTNLE
jgi:hypothetical protein